MLTFGFVIGDLQNGKRDHPHSPLSKVEVVGIVVISFRNIAKKQMYPLWSRLSPAPPPAPYPTNPPFCSKSQSKNYI